jgi:hypothetical protein
VSLLVAVTWETQPWVERFMRHLPSREIVVLGEDFDRSRIRYVATWGRSREAWMTCRTWRRSSLSVPASII